jgi:hypothetical protein
MEDTYYAEISWEDYVIANSGKKYQFSVGFYGKGYTDPTTNKYVFYQFDPSNDWSYDGIKMGVNTDFFAVDDPPEERYEHICVYADGVLVGGIEPDGTVPEKKEEEKPAASKTTTTTAPKATTTTTTKAAGTTTTTSAPKAAVTTITNSPATSPVVKNDDVKYGDANCDGDVSLADSVLIMQSLSNPSKFGESGSDKNHITKQGSANADCSNVGDGVTNKDALAIQKYKLNLIKKLPEAE